MSGERETLGEQLDRLKLAIGRGPYRAIDDPASLVRGLADLASQEIEAIHAMYRPRIERLESEIERLTVELETVKALAMGRGVV